MTLRDEITPSIKPGDDFYSFVNKKWCDAHPIPADKARYAAFTELDERIIEQLRTLLISPINTGDSQSRVLAKKRFQISRNSFVTL